jgi:hypothetical protein
MLVRLMGFPALPSNKRTIYVIEQQNEALYIQLNASIVTAFLQRNGVLDQLPPPPGRSAAHSSRTTKISARS